MVFSVLTRCLALNQLNIVYNDVMQLLLHPKSNKSNIFNIINFKFCNFTNTNTKHPSSIKWQYEKNVLRASNRVFRTSPQKPRATPEYKCITKQSFYNLCPNNTFQPRNPAVSRNQLAPNRPNTEKTEWPSFQEENQDRPYSRHLTYRLQNKQVFSLGFTR